jgi:hypothetical protein
VNERFRKLNLKCGFSRESASRAQHQQGRLLMEGCVAALVVSYPTSSYRPGCTVGAPGGGAGGRGVALIVEGGYGRGGDGEPVSGTC